MLAASMGVAASLGPVREARAPVLGALLVGGCAWWLAIEHSRTAAVPWALVVLGALAMRVPMLLASTELSDDIHRYVWEGELLRRGSNPYAHAPSAPENEGLRRELAETGSRVNHPAVPAAYPPATLGAFAAVAVLSRATGPEEGFEARTRGLLRGFFALCDLLVLLPLRRLVARRGGTGSAIVAWAWSPLVAVEFAGSGHFDSLGILLWMAGLASLSAAGSLERASSRRGLLASGLIACASLVKYLPACSLPFAARGRGAWARWLLAATLFLGAFGLLSLWCGDARGPLGGLAEYGLRWESSSLTYRFVEGALARVLERDLSLLDARRVGRLLILAAWLAVWAVLFARRASPLRAASVLTGLFLVLTPTLHPWYLTWMLPFVALAPSRAWIWLCAVAPLLYWPLPAWQTAGVWSEPSWSWPLIALPFFVLGLFDWLSARRAAAPALS